MVSEKQRLAIIGIGNDLAGDDGVGVEVIRRLETMGLAGQGVFLHTLVGDHFEIADLLCQAERFIFVDAIEGERSGELIFMENTRRAFAPSFHQTDVATVMHMLEAIGIIDPFPAWEICGVTIQPPSALGEGLSHVVEQAVEKLCQRLCEVVRETTREGR